MDRLQLKAPILSETRKFLPLEHAVLRELRKAGVERRGILVAVSGGLDSVVLLTILKRLQPLIRSPLFVAHIYHGTGSRQQTAFRKKTRAGVRALADELGLPFHTNKTFPKKKLKSEEELRDFRYSELEKIRSLLSLQRKRGTLSLQERGAVPFLALAHHQEDLLETQVMRLIRGTGVTGLKAMSFLVNGILRPLLFCEKKDIVAFASQMNLQWWEDPSNTDQEPLRNWLRQVWLPELEKKIPGGKASLARSLNLLAKATDQKTGNAVGKIRKRGRSLNRAEFLSLVREQKISLVVRYLRFLDVRKYTQGQIEEIVRRLDTRRGEFTFTLLKHKWHVNAQRIQALKN